MPSEVTASPPSPPILRALPDRLIGPRVVVRPLRPGDGGPIWEAVQESRGDLGAWMPWVAGTRAPSDSEAYAREAQARWLLRETDLPLSVWTGEPARFLGGLGLHSIRWPVPSCQIGYWLRLSAQGHGYMTEAASLLRALAFGALGMRRVAIHCDARNGRSAALARRLGFAHEATLRNECRDHYGEVRDTLIFALTDADHAQHQEEAFHVT